MTRKPTPKDNEISKDSSISRLQSFAILGASILAAVSTFGSTVIAQRVLPATAVTEFLLFWALLFGIYGVIGGIASEATRAVGSVRASNTTKPGARPTTVALIIGVLAAFLVGVTAPYWGPNVITQSFEATIALVLVATVLYSVQSAMVGTSSGQKNWYLLATINGGEALWRLMAMIVIGVLANSLWGLEVAVVFPVLLWIVLTLVSPNARSAFLARGDVGAAKLFMNTLIAMASAASSAILTIGFPLVINFAENTTPGSQEDIMLGALVLAISITRSPIIMPVQAFQGVSISYFMKNAHRPFAAMVKPALALIGFGALGSLGAYLVGPTLFLAMYKPKPEQVVAYGSIAQGDILAMLTFASAFMGLLILSATAVLAVNMHNFYIAGWVAAAVVSSVLLFIPVDLTNRVIISLFFGPLSGIFIHLAGLFLGKNQRQRQVI